MSTLLHGSEDLIRAERLAAIRAGLGPAELAELSTTELDGRKTSLSEIRHHCDAIPFLTPLRLVVVEGLLASLQRRLQGAGRGSAAARERKELLSYLELVPETTHLVLVEADTLNTRNVVYKRLAELAGKGQAEIVRCEAPAQSDLPAWVIHRAQQKGAQIESSAAADLATCVGRNLRLLDNELEKLVAYRADEGPIRRQDVRLLVPYLKEASIFDMVDAIGRRDGAMALRLLRELERDGAAPLYLLAMIVRQFRILVQVSDQMASGLDKQTIARNIGLHPYPTGKAMQQSRQWRMADLQAVYERLLATDLSIKTGKMPDDLALDLLVVELRERQLQ